MDNVTRESKHVNNLIEPRQQYEGDFANILRIQKMYNTIVWVYTTRGEGKVEWFKPLVYFEKDRRDDRILVWGNHCTLVKNIENLIERPNRSQHKFYYFDRCKY